MIGHGLSLDLGNNTSHENSVGQYDHQYGADDRQRNVFLFKKKMQKKRFLYAYVQSIKYNWWQRPASRDLFEGVGRE